MFKVNIILFCLIVVYNAKSAKKIICKKRKEDIHLAADAFDLLILVADLGAHVNGHISQIANHAAHLHQVLVHLVFARVIRDTVDEALRGSLSLGEDAARRVRVHFAIIVTFPRFVVRIAFLKAF
jgi:hypothetical protein